MACEGLLSWDQAAMRSEASSAREDAHRFGDHRSINHLSGDLNGARTRFGGGCDALRPGNLAFAWPLCCVDRLDLLRMDAQLGTEAAGAREVEIGEELRLVTD